MLVNDPMQSVANRKALKGRKRRKGKGASGSNRKKRPFLKWMLLVVIGTIFLIMGGCSAVILAGNYAVDEKKLVMPQTSVFLDQDGKEFGQVAEEDRKYVSLSEMPDYLGQAFIAVEDRRFMHHYGVDPRAVARAVWVDIKTRSLAEGSSTITMQLARNVFLTNEKVWNRKIKEALIAINLEQHYTKEQILEMYLNQIYFGHNKYGVETAADWYFNKTVRKNGKKETISLSEAALLAGLPKAPENYSPKKNLKKALERRDLVLDLMAEQGFITEEEKQQAMAEKITIASNTGKGNKYDAYLDLVRKEAQERYGLTADELNRGGFRIYTNLNRQAQEAGEKAFRDDNLFPADGPYGKVQGGMAMINPKTGAIVAVAGGRGYEASNFNRAMAKVQAGSAMKPIAAFAPAVEYKGMNPYDTVIDEPIKRENGKPWPQNNGGVYHGRAYMIDALAHSYNAAAVWLLKEVGVKTGYEFVTNLGLEIDEKFNNDDMYSLTLGGPTVSPLEMAQAYSPFANKGVWVEAHAIQKIERSDGSELPVDDPKVKEVMSSRTAYYMTVMMQAVVNEGTGQRAKLYGRDVAGKTGTTNGSTRIWFVGYTPQYVTAIYMGRDKDQEHPVGESSGGPRGPAHLFARIMEEALKGMPVENFPQPEGVPQPERPLTLKKITDLRASYDPATTSVSLSWTDFDDRAQYNVYRIEGSGGDGQLIGQTESGSFVDSAIEVPAKGSGVLDMLLKSKEKVYHYYVVPVDPQTGELGERSNTATVVIGPPEDAVEAPEDETEEEEDGESDGDDAAPDTSPPANEAPTNPSQGNQPPEGTAPPEGEEQNPGGGQGKEEKQGSRNNVKPQKVNGVRPNSEETEGESAP